MRHTRPLRLGALAVSLIAGAAVLTTAPAVAVTGSPAADATHAYTAKLVIGDHDRGCSGVLVDSEWLLTAASCFAENPAADLTVPTGIPERKTTATIGASGAATDGVVREVVELVPHHQGRDLLMARLDEPVTGVTPVALAKTPPAVGETVQAVGFGRTKTEWAPNKPHAGNFTVDVVDSGGLAVTGQNGDAICPGDTGGPLIADRDGTAELVAVSSRSWQGGCWGIDETEQRTGAIGTRVDDLNPWIHRVRSLPTQAHVVAGDFNGDGNSDLAAFYDYGQDAQGRFRSSLWVFDSDGTSYAAPRVVWESGSTSWAWGRSKVVSGDYNGDGKADIGVLYDLGATDNGFRSRLWTFSSTGDSFQAPVVAWDSAGTTSWNWDISKVVSGDHTGDGKADIAAWYEAGPAADGRTRHGLWNFTSTGEGMNAPHRDWYSVP